MNLKASFLISALLCPILSRPGTAQVRTLEQVPPKTELRLQLLDSTIVHGRFAGLEQGEIRLGTIAGSVAYPRLAPRSVARDSIAALWAASGTHWKQGAVVGAATGVVTLFVVALAGDQEGSGGCDVKCWAAVGTLPLLGGVLGLFVGHQFVIWRPVSF